MVPPIPSSSGKRMASNFPSWTQINKNPESLGRKVLDSYGKEVDSIYDELTRMLSRRFLDTLDTSQPHEVYASVLPKSADLFSKYSVYSNNEPLLHSPNLQKFYSSSQPSFFVEIRTRTVYINTSPVDLAFVQGSSSKWLDPYLHPVWNDFDEFGLLLGLERIPGESNEKYRSRLKTVGQVLPGSSRGRLVTDWARRTGIVFETSWSGSEDLFIPDALYTACFVDGKLYFAEEKEDGALLPAIPGTDYTPKKVVAILKINSYPLWSREDSAWLSSNLYDGWQNATSSYRSISSEIGRRAPVLWRDIHSDNVLWESGAAVESGLGHIPVKMDSPFPKGEFNG